MTAECFLQNGIPAQADCPLSELCSFRIGGRAGVAVFPRTREELILALRTVLREGAPFDVAGNGTNLLFPDGVYPGVLIVTRRMREADFSGAEVTASAGMPLPALAAEAMRRGLSGLEFAQGIPGTVGGGVFMNAGAFGGCMADVTVWSECFDTGTGEVLRFCGAEQCFGTRTSIYERNKRYILLGAGLHLTPGDPAAIARKTEDCRTRRARTQPLDLPSAGSVFRHPPGAFAGKLIEDCGLKGTRIGGAEVSTLHAGFIVNTGGATAADVEALIARIRETVLRRTGYRLECEVRTLTYR